MNLSTSNDGTALVARIKAADEALDVDAFLELLSSDVKFRLGGQPPVRGKDAVRDVVTALFSRLKGLHHDIEKVLVHDGHVVFEAEVTYRFKAGPQVTLPYADILKLDAAGLVRDYRIYIDLSPLSNEAS